MDKNLNKKTLFRASITSIHFNYNFAISIRFKTEETTKQQVAGDMEAGDVAAGDPPRGGEFHFLHFSDIACKLPPFSL